MPDCRVVNLLHGLRVGGKEKGVLQQVRWARERGDDDRILLFEHPAENNTNDLDPGGIPVTYVPRSGRMGGTFASSFRRHLRETNTAIVHARGATPLFLAALALLPMRRHRPSLVGTYHGYPFGMGRRARCLARWAALNADWVSVVSEELGQRLRTDGFIGRFEVTRNGIPVGPMREGVAVGDIRRELCLEPGAFLVGHIGRLDANKRHDVLLKAWNIVSKRRPESRLVLVGQGPAGDSVRAALTHVPGASLRPRVPDVEAFLRELDLFVLCSDHEGLPRSILEAMAVGVPVVATRAGGVPEILEAGSSAFGGLAAPGDAASLAIAINRALDSPSLRATWSINARQRVATHFSGDVAWQRYENLYQRVLSDARPST